MTEMQIKKLESKGAKRWKKNGMDRMYISLDVVSEWCDAKEAALDAADLLGIRAYLNRFERQNGKVWFEVSTGELMMKNISAKEVKTIVEMFIA